ncbi:alanine--tRNA ligase [Patescibacteria group bacterium]|nr:alanine--tRNA ligase [Patescibacteria group bacterium]MBU1074593.1 alanine--tRNA ligase [Patescibacteria group bacterium]MBU1952382.1 alanine--tRNA ligase [Patescibacteria group bacterium]
MTELELRNKFLEYFRKKKHAIIAPASLIPENDSSVLFTTAGMHPLVPYLLGEIHPEGKRLANFQKCIRTGDIDEVGDDWHLTFFEMLGNWSLGDYFKSESIKWSYEFLTKELGIPNEKLAITVFKGNDDAPFDKESFELWKDQGISEDKIYMYGKSENWWGPAGITGPCGPDTEIFYITNRNPCSKDCQPSCNCGKYNEIWNNVFMEYNKISNGDYEPLSQKNVDTGMGLERTVAILNGRNSVYDIDLFKPVFQKLRQLSSITDLVAERVVIDHVRSACFLLLEDIVPSNVDQGYVLRRLIRRAIRQARKLGINTKFTQDIANAIFESHIELYPEISKKKEFILTEMQNEEEKFARTLQKGLKVFEKELEIFKNSKKKEDKFSGKAAFYLYQTYGFPIEMIEEELKDNDIELNRKQFDTESKNHQKLSRNGAKKKFAGGLADHSDETIKLHTATHLLHQALRLVLGEHVMQKGSNITTERLRFDFTHPQKLTPDEIIKVETLVNEQIQRALPVTVTEITVEEAKRKNAIGLFEKKYGTKVKVYKVGDFSIEICGGPHVSTTKELNSFRIIKEQAVSAGIRRIKAKVQ